MKFLMFLLGAAVGAAGAYYAAKTHYEAEIDEVIDEVREYRNEARKRQKRASTCVTEASEEKEIRHGDAKGLEDELYNVTEEDVDKYSKICKSNNYNKPDPAEVVEEKKPKKGKPKKIKGDVNIFEISPAQFQDGTVADSQTVILYDDGVVIDEENEEVIDNGYALLGGSEVIDQAERELEWNESKTFFVRNLNNGIDYEVIVSDDKYSEFSPDIGPEDE